MRSVQSNRFGLSRSKDAKKAAANAADAEPATPDFSAKLLHLAWHPEAPLIAAAGDRARLCHMRLSEGVSDAVGTDASGTAYRRTVCDDTQHQGRCRRLSMYSCLASSVLGLQHPTACTSTPRRRRRDNVSNRSATQPAQRQQQAQQAAAAAVAAKLPHLMQRQQWWAASALSAAVTATRHGTLTTCSSHQ
jgi:hypothetical protein